MTTGNEFTEEWLAERLKENPDLGIDKSILSKGDAPKRDKVTRNGYNKYRVSAKEDRTLNGKVYASKKEMNQAIKLDAMVQSGEISFYLRQVPFDLGAGIRYLADFVTYRGWHSVGLQGDRIIHYEVTVIEVKGFWNSTAKMKMKLFKAKYPDLEIEIW
jgi:hypothetical protein